MWSRCLIHLVNWILMIIDSILSYNRWIDSVRTLVIRYSSHLLNRTSWQTIIRSMQMRQWLGSNRTSVWLIWSVVVIHYVRSMYANRWWWTNIRKRESESSFKMIVFMIHIWIEWILRKWLKRMDLNVIRHSIMDVMLRK